MNNNIENRLSDIQIGDNVISYRNMKVVKKEEKIRQLLEELIESEMKYVKDLEEVTPDKYWNVEIINCPRFAEITLNIRLRWTRRRRCFTAWIGDI